MTHLSDLASDLATLLTLTITQYPEEVAGGQGYLLYPGNNYSPRNGIQTTEIFMVRIGSDSLANLETAIDKFLDADSIVKTSGYTYAAAGHALWLDISLENKQWNAVEFMALIRIEASYV